MRELSRFCILGLLGVGLALVASAREREWSTYQPIVERNPFGLPPADPMANPKNVNQRGPSGRPGEPGQLTPEQDKLRKQVRFSVLNRDPDGSVMVGFSDLSDSKMPRHYYLAEGETRDGWKVVSAEIATKKLTLLKDGIELELTLGEGEAQAKSPTSATESAPAPVAAHSRATPAAAPAPAPVAAKRDETIFPTVSEKDKQKEIGELNKSLSKGWKERRKERQLRDKKMKEKALALQEKVESEQREKDARLAQTEADLEATRARLKELQAQEAESAKKEAMLTAEKEEASAMSVEEGEE